MKRTSYFLYSLLLVGALILPAESFSQNAIQPVESYTLETVAADELLVHYKFDESSGDVAYDSSGNSFDGIISGTPEWVAGHLDGALAFKGTDYITLPAEAIRLTPAVGSVTFWVKADLPSTINTIFWAGDNTTGGGFGPENELHVHVEMPVADVWEGGELVFFAVTTASDQFIFIHSDPDKGGADERANPPVNPVLIADQEWHHVAATWDGDDGFAKTFIDGEFVAESEYIPGSYELSHILVGQMAKGDRNFTGTLDDLRIYSYALNGTQILNIFENEDINVSDNQIPGPEECILFQNHPNPFNKETTIPFRLSRNNVHVSLDVYNSNGQRVELLTDRKLNSGMHRVTFNANEFSPGVYYYRLQAEDFIQVNKMFLVR